MVWLDLPGGTRRLSYQSVGDARSPFGLRRTTASRPRSWRDPMSQTNGQASVQQRIVEEAKGLEREWAEDARWMGIGRPYSPEAVVRLRGSVGREHTLARLGASRLWQLLSGQDYVAALRAPAGGQAGKKG